MVRAPLLAAALAVLPLLPAAAGSAPLDELLGKVVDAYGGVAALGRAVAVEERGTVHALVRHAGQVGELRRVFQPPDQLRVEVAYPDGEREVRVVAGDHGWRDGEAVAGPLLASMQVQAACLALPWLLHERRAAVTDQGVVERAGVALRPVGGVIFAFREANYASGTHTADTVLESVTLLDRVAPGTFGPGSAPVRTTQISPSYPGPRM